MHRYFSSAVAALAAAMSCAFAGPAAAAEAYPQRAVRLIIPYPPGGAGDFVGRLMANGLTETLGQQVVADNRGGGGQTIATQIAANAQPDGHTVFLASATHAINPSLRKNLPYDTLKAFSPVTLIAQSPLVYVAHPSLGVGSIKELIAAAKAKPGVLNYASSGPGTGGHMAFELLKSMTGIDIVHIPYKGAGPAMVDVVAGQVRLMCTSPVPAMPHVKSGRLKALALTSLKRSSAYPDLPVVAETIPGFQTTLWYALLVPAGTPAPIVKRLHADAVKIIRSPDVEQKLLRIGGEPIGNRPAEVQAFIRDEMARWQKVVKAAKISLDR